MSCLCIHLVTLFNLPCKNKIAVIQNVRVHPRSRHFFTGLEARDGHYIVHAS